MGDPQVIGLRYIDVTIPKGSTITDAWVQFQVDETKGGAEPVNLIIEGELSADAAAFTSDAFSVTSRARTTAQTQWSVPNWTNVGDRGPDQATPNIAAIIQEIVNQDGWASGNALVLIFSDDPANPSTGIRCAEGGPGGDAALLHVEFQAIVALNPDPADGVIHWDTWVTLTWTPGHTAASHDVYFSENLADVNDGTPVASTTDASYTIGLDVPGDILPTGLVSDTTYYWRIDEVEADGTTVHKGDVWSFTAIIVPEIAITDPNLIGWWTFDEGEGTLALDASGHDNTGVVKGATWVADGQIGGALDFDGTDDYVGTGKSLLDNMSEFSLTCWAAAGNPGSDRIGLVGQNDLIEMGFMGGNAQIWTAATGTTKTPWTFDNYTWHHIAIAADATSLKIYIDGQLKSTGGGTANYGTSSYPVNIGGGGIWDADGNWFLGQIDDVRIYNITLSDAEIQAMVAPPEAWAPSPADGATEVEKSPTLSWLSGSTAASHDVYFSDSSPPAFIGNQTETSYSPGSLEKGKTYYWRIDEVEADGTTKYEGNVWSFTVTTVGR